MNWQAMNTDRSMHDASPSATARMVSRGGYSLLVSPEVAESALDPLIEKFRDAPPSAAGALAGRAGASALPIEGVATVVVKHYRRGGLLGRCNSRLYLRFGMTRAEREFALLNAARAVGINAPVPLLAAWRGRLVYQAWLAMRWIENDGTLATISVLDEDRVRRVSEALVAQIRLLIEHRIMHVDLHPGNVIVDRQDQVYILDFDKAATFHGSQNRLRDMYLHRWRRAVIKHGLPEILVEAVCLSLLRDFDG